MLSDITMTLRSRIMSIAIATSALAATSAGLLVMIFGLASSLLDRVRDMPWTYWILSIALIGMVPVLIVVVTDRGRKPRNCEQVVGAVTVLTVLAAIRPLIVAFGLDQPAALAERAPWIALSLINVSFGALLVAAAEFSARRMKAEEPRQQKN
jgi:hypothetical protein